MFNTLIITGVISPLFFTYDRCYTHRDSFAGFIIVQKEKEVKEIAFSVYSFKTILFSSFRNLHVNCFTASFNEGIL